MQMTQDWYSTVAAAAAADAGRAAAEVKQPVAAVALLLLLQLPVVAVVVEVEGSGILEYRDAFYFNFEMVEEVEKLWSSSGSDIDSFHESINLGVYSSKRKNTDFFKRVMAI